MPEPELESIVNVASVPMRSPFRYPGGKTWLVPKLRQWMRSQRNRPRLFIEPFAGGAIASLTVAFEDLAERVLMVELDRAVAAVWKTILRPEGAAWLAQEIVRYDLTREACERDLAKPAKSIRQQAFLTILRNRVCRGGIMAPGAGLSDYGENGKGVRSRWYPDTLKRRILEIAFIAQRLTFREGDAFKAMEEFAEHDDVCFFLDPPYTASKKKAGSRLYRHWDIDHERLFKLASSVRGDVLLTYDHAGEIVDLSKRYGFETRLIAMKNTHHAEMNEMLIGRDLSWI